MLMDLGFAREDCHKALTECRENTDAAAVWLTANCTYQAASEAKQNFEITHAEVHAGFRVYCNRVSHTLRYMLVLGFTVIKYHTR